MADFKFVKEYYNNRYKEDCEGSVKPWQIAEGVRSYDAFPMFLDYLSAAEGKNLLDIACGRGYLLKAAELKSINAYGVDISEEAIKIAKTIAKKSDLKVSNAENLPYPDKFFDYVSCLGSFEHFLNPDDAIKEMIRVAKNDARFCIMVPNSNFIYWKLKKNKGTHQQDVQETLRSLDEWKEVLNKGGLKAVKVLHDEYNFKQKIFTDFRLLFILRRIVLRAVRLVLPLNYTYQFVFICEKI